MSYIEKANQNKLNAEKADAWNEMQESMRVREEAERLLAEKEAARMQRPVSGFASTGGEYSYQPNNPRAFTPQELQQHIIDNEALYQANNPRGSVNQVLQQRTQEPESSWWSDTVNRLKNFDFFTNQSNEQQAEYNRMGQEMRQQMEDDAFQTAIDRAAGMGDRSEENINRLIQEELKKRGL